MTQENNGKLIDELLDGSLQVLDLCRTAKDALLPTKERVQELQSILSRRVCGETGLTRCPEPTGELGDVHSRSCRRSREPLQEFDQNKSLSSQRPKSLVPELF
ncbi:hypothetical protein SADUNF_Sadunf09G0116300 [Salix dunnii]|uniref:Uncharacterized protein n=1 Tax=Salix dunnii TaxID=1413687 RepID=A0A835JW34_9ROSI|nr:hypothetical protein SADUNF_Sadunf09G0116300 [Salix dunnii]